MRDMFGRKFTWGRLVIAGAVAFILPWVFAGLTGRPDLGNPMTYLSAGILAVGITAAWWWTSPKTNSDEEKKS